MTRSEYDGLMGRRAFLRSSAVAGSLAALSGCAGVSLDDVPGMGGSDVSLRQYAYAPDAVDKDAYGVALFDTAMIDEVDTDLPDRVVDDFESRYAWLHEVTGVDFDDATTVAAFDSTVVMTADYTQDDVDDELDGAEFDDDDEMNGFTLYQNDEETHSVAIDGSLIVGATLTGEVDEAIEVLETTLDTANGDEDRYVDETAVFGTLLDSLDGGVAATGQVHAATEETDTEVGTFEDERARGVRVTVDAEAETTTHEFVFVFDEGTEPPADDIREWTTTDLFTDFDATTVETADTVATIEATTDLDGFTFSVPRGVQSLAEYIPAPSEISDQEQYGSTFVTASADAISAADTNRKRLFEDALDGSPLSTLFDPSLFAQIALVDDVTISTVDGDSEELTRTLEANDFREARSVGDVTIYRHPDGRVVGAGSGIAVAAGTRASDPVGLVETVAGTTTGDTARYVDTNEDFGASYGRLSEYDASFLNLWAEPIQDSYPAAQRLEGMIARGGGFTFVDGGAQFEFLYRFDERADVPQETVDDLTETIRDGSGIYGGISSVQTRQTGAFLILSGEASVE